MRRLILYGLLGIVGVVSLYVVYSWMTIPSSKAQQTFYTETEIYNAVYDSANRALRTSGGGGTTLTIQEIDGSPTGTPSTLKFSNGAVTNNGDGSFTIVTGAGGGGDFSSNTATSVDNEIVLFSGTGGKTGKRATTTGMLKGTSGVLSAGTAGTDYVAPGGALGTPSSGTLTNATGLPLSSGVTGTLLAGNGGTGVTSAADDNVLLGNGTVWQSKALTGCSSASSAMTYDTTTNTFGCNTISGSGTVNSGTAGDNAYYAATGTAVSTTSSIRSSATEILSARYRPTTKNASATLGTSDGPVVGCDTTSGAVTLTLPAASTAQGVWSIIKTDTSANLCSVQRGGSDTINGGTVALSIGYKSERIDLIAVSTTDWSGIVGTLPKRYITIECISDATALTTGDGKCYWPVHPDFNGWVAIGVSAHLGAAVSSSGAVNIDIDICGAVATGIRCSGSNRDLLSTNITIDANEDGTETAAATAVINTSNDDLATGEWVRWNVDSAGTGAQGLYVTLVIQKP